MTLNLQGIKAETTESKLEFYRKALGEKMGAVYLSAGGVSIMSNVQPKHAEGLMVLCEHLFQAQEGELKVDELFQDIETLDQASHRLNLIRGLLEQIDDEEDFPGKQKARAALADLSLELKRLIRLNRV